MGRYEGRNRGCARVLASAREVRIHQSDPLGRLDRPGSIRADRRPGRLRHGQLHERQASERRTPLLIHEIEQPLDHLGVQQVEHSLGLRLVLHRGEGRTREPLCLEAREHLFRRFGRVAHQADEIVEHFRVALGSFHGALHQALFRLRVWSGGRVALVQLVARLLAQLGVAHGFERFDSQRTR